MGCSAGLQLGWAGLWARLLHFETKKRQQIDLLSTGGITLMPKQRQQMVLREGRPSGDEAPKTVVIVIGWLRWLGWAALLGFSWAGLGCGFGFSALRLRDQNNGNLSYFLVLGHHFDAKTTTTKTTRTCLLTSSQSNGNT